MCAYENTRKILAHHGLAPSKTRGQNFLVHSGTAESIVSAAGFDPDDHVVEVGVGIGALTLPLAAQVTGVTGIEIDKGLVHYLESEQILPPNVTLLHADILKTDITRLASTHDRKLKIIANLPYSISNPFLFHMLAGRMNIDQIVVMLQKEVADRLTAAPGGKDYGIPTVLFGCCAHIEKLLTVGPAQFHPRPKVDSQVIRITFLDTGDTDELFPLFTTIVRAAFHKRRKTLLNNLSSSRAVLDVVQPRPDRPKDFIAEILVRGGLDPAVRAEAVRVGQFQDIARLLSPPEKQG